MIAMSPFGYWLDYIVLWLLYLGFVTHAICFFKLFPRERYPRLGLVLGNLFVFGVMLGTIAMIGEIYLRFYSVKTEALGMSLPARRWFALNTSLNDVGCRDEAWSRDKNGARRIAFVGDSYTYGWGIVDPADRFTDLIETQLAGRTPAVDVMNVAKPGWGTADQVRPVNDLIEYYGVDEVVLCYLPNDMETAIDTDASFDPTKPPESSWLNPDFSCLLYELYLRLVLPRTPTVRDYHAWLMEAFRNEATWQRHARDLSALVEICRRHDVRMRVVLLPFILEPPEPYDGQYVRRKVRSLFDDAGIECLDLHAVVADANRRELIVNAADPHPNEAAHRLFADAIRKAFYDADASKVP